jgi:thioredoxin-related protein
MADQTRNPFRRRLLLASAALVLPRAFAAAPLLPAPRSLAAESAAAVAKGKALVLMVSLDRCPFCKIVRENYLVPLLRDDGQPVVQIDIAHGDPVVDFTGAASTHEQVIRALGVKVAPTVLFLGPGGRELAPRLVGLPTADFYGGYLQERVDAANRAAG